ncbi:MAG: hypothetical protein H0Z40_03725 [Desulfotomaculum sp.]|nr:hypothetical protein [Desulfotomaculum sp.]
MYKFIASLFNHFFYSPCHIQEDEVELQLEDVSIKLIRKLNIKVPHEVTIVIPRVELRDRKYKDDQLVEERERIYNSVTVVHAPRHPYLENKSDLIEPATSINSMKKNI